jgi:thioredoxin-dependent peroxiredoxin
MLETGKPFPAFSLPNQDGATLRLADFKGKWLVVYTYPKDDTPGCTLEGKSFSASKPSFDQIGAVVVGLSADDVKSHKSFCDKFSFTVPLLADTRAELLTALGVGQSEFKGVKYWDRVTFLVDPRGVIRKVYPKVKPDGHDQQVLRDLKELQRSGA